MNNNTHGDASAAKFAGFNRLIVKAKADHVDTVIIALPEALGDNYHELVENLNKLADANLSLRIVPRKDRR